MQYTKQVLSPENQIFLLKESLILKNLGALTGFLCILHLLTDVVKYGTIGKTERVNTCEKKQIVL